jgi:hypothetical protein
MQILDRSEMKNIMAGDGSGGSVYIMCAGCQNSTCQGYADDCETGAYEICGPGTPGSPGPAQYDCTFVMESG